MLKEKMFNQGIFFKLSILAYFKTCYQNIKLYLIFPVIWRQLHLDTDPIYVYCGTLI